MFRNKMFKAIFILLCFVSLSLAQSGNKVGVGIAIVDIQQFFEMIISQGSGMTATLTLPIEMSPSFRIEPEFGYFRASVENKNAVTQTETVTNWRIGAGLFPQKTYDKFVLYYGARIGYISQTQTDEVNGSKEEATTTGFYIAPAIGGEHFLSDHFSLGGEAQLTIASLSSEREGSDYEQSILLLNTRGLVFFRFYF